MEQLYESTPYPTLNQNSPTAIEFFLASSTDHKSAVTGATPILNISQNGSAFAAPAGIGGEIGLGWYKQNLLAADVSVAGNLIVSVTASGCDPYEQTYTVLPSPAINDVNFGLPTTTGVYVFGQQAENLTTHGNILSHGANR